MVSKDLHTTRAVEELPQEPKCLQRFMPAESSFVTNSGQPDGNAWFKLLVSQYTPALQTPNNKLQTTTHASTRHWRRSTRRNRLRGIPLPRMAIAILRTNVHRN